MLNRFFLFLLLVCAVTCAGCAAQQLASYETSGFLGSYANFEAGAEDQPNLVYLNPARDLSRYDKVLIDHVVVYFHPESKNRGVDPAQLNELTRYFHQALVHALGRLSHC
ncbi:MAG: DUF3313 family protein [Deltaproteobacteria bacterium]|jgi:long-subunit fatty acid transport protein|nr:DUF3313 family protein [Deltaproteobacteria bacterium]